jgi:hypothetical protein
MSKDSWSYELVIHGEVGLNTSTMALQVVGDDEKGSLKSETVKYGSEPQGLGPKRDCAGKAQQHI